jgi:4-hydroxybenzoyl-CoA thioesterase
MITNSRTVRIEWGHCDPAGIVFFPRYFEMFDASTTALFEHALGMRKSDITRTYGAGGYPMVDTRARFLRPSRYGDDVVIESSVKEFRRSSFDVLHRLFKDSELAVEGFETRVWVVPDADQPGGLKAKPIPREIVARFEAG